MEHKSCKWNCRNLKEVIITLSYEPCRSGWLMEQNSLLWLVLVSFSGFERNVDILLFFSGSLYLLMLIACCKLKSRICSLTGDMVPRLASLIRHPTKDTVSGRQVINSIIPSLTNLRDAFHLSFSTMFSYQMLHDYNLSSDFNAANLEKSDNFFDSLPLK